MVSTSYCKCCSANSSSVEKGDSMQEIPVRVNHVAMVFKADIYYGMSSDKEWESLMPSGYHSGFIRLNASSSPFEPSLYHQLHCLNNLRKIYMGPSWAGDDIKEWHVKHCLNFIFRAVLCNGDTTLEPSFQYELNDGRLIPATHGVNVTHRCRDWTVVRSFAEGNYRLYKDVPFNITAHIVPGEYSTVVRSLNDVLMTYSRSWSG